MTENKGTRADLPEGGGVDEVSYAASASPATPIDPDEDLDYTGEGGDGQETRVGDGTIS